MALVIEGLTKRFGEVQALDGVDFTVRAGRHPRLPRRQRRRKDDDDADHPRLPPRRRGSVTWNGRAGRDLAAPNVGLHARGARPVPADAGPRAARLLRLAVRDAARARPVTRSRSTGWPASASPSYADRRAESLSKGNQQKVQFIATILHDPDVAADGRAVRRARPDQRGAPEGGVPRDARPGQDARLQHPPARPGRGAVRLGRDHRSRPGRRGRARPARSSARPDTRSSAWPRRGDGDLAWLRSLPHVTVTRPGEDYTELRVDAGSDPQAILRAAMAQGRRRPPLRGRRPVARGGLRRARRRARSDGADAGGRPGGPIMSGIVEHPIAVARREFTFRVRTRSFVIGDAIADPRASSRSRSRPVIVRCHRPERHRADRAVTSRRPASPGTRRDPRRAPQRVDAERRAPRRGARPRLRRHAGPATSRPPDRPSRPATRAAVLAIERARGGDLAFTFYTNDQPDRAGRTSGARPPGATAIAIARPAGPTGRRAGRPGGLFAPADFALAPAGSRRRRTGPRATEVTGSDMLGFGMTILIFMMIILYGNWVAMSVVEEKSSRVMEVILNAATPFQLLTGKVLGVGAVALVPVRGAAVGRRRRAAAPGPGRDARARRGGRRRQPAAGPDRRPAPAVRRLRHARLPAVTPCCTRRRARWSAARRTSTRSSCR